MVGKIAGLDAVRYKESVIGVGKMVGAVDKVGLEMDVMVLLGELLVIYVNLEQVCQYVNLNRYVLINLTASKLLAHKLMNIQPYSTQTFPFGAQIF